MKKEFRTRRTFIVIHRYVGLLLGLAIVVLGITGSVAVFWRELDIAIRPELRVEVPQGAQALPLDAMLGILKRAHPDRQKPWTLEPPYAQGYPFYGVYERPEEQGGEISTMLYVAMNPYTGEILSQWRWGETLASWVYELHASFHGGLAGHRIVGILGVVVLFISLSGLYVWWPIGRFARRHFAVNLHAGVPRAELDLHRAGGFYTLPLFLVLAITGYLFVFPQQGAALMAKFSPLASQTPTDIHGGDETHGTGDGSEHAQDDTRYVRSHAHPGIAALSVDAALKRALEVFPGAQLKRIYTPAGADGVFGIILRQPAIEPLHKTYPRTEIWLDQHDGRVLVTADPARHSTGQRALDLVLPLHNGEAAGLAGRILICAIGLAPLLMFVTGLLQWLRRRRIARSESGRAPGPAGDSLRQGAQ